MFTFLRGMVIIGVSRNNSSTTSLTIVQEWQQKILFKFGYMQKDIYICNVLKVVQSILSVVGYSL